MNAVVAEILLLAILALGVWGAYETVTAQQEKSGSYADTQGAYLTHGPDNSTMACAPILYIHNGYAYSSGATACHLASIKEEVNLPRGI